MALKDWLFKRKRTEWAAETTAATRLDVRPLLARGEDPLKLALEMADKTGLGGIFIIDAPFDPAPMRRMFSNLGFEDYAEELAGDHWRVHFHRVASAAEAAADGAKAARVWREAEDWHIDVRGLEPPAPMRAIISLIETPAVSGPVIVHHEREPIYLYPELAERGWRWAQIAGEPGEVRLRLEQEKKGK
jgi:uncharacterized protein (DUF2249 family)